MRTPGDWQTKPLKNAGPTVMTLDHSRPMVDQDGKTWPTVEMVCECRSMDDARLISAAPVMLALLHEADRLYTIRALEAQPVDGMAPGKWINQVRAVLGVLENGS